jgi:hypothetical protein
MRKFRSCRWRRSECADIDQDGRSSTERYGRVDSHRVFERAGSVGEAIS